MAQKPTPVCKKCFKGPVVWADAGMVRSIPYLYCRNCKIEVNQFGHPVIGKRNTSGIEELEDYLFEKMTENHMDYEEILDLDDDDDDDFSNGYPFSFRMTP